MDLKFDNPESLRDATLHSLSARHKWVCYPLKKSALEPADLVSVTSIKEANQFCLDKNMEDGKAAYGFQPLDNLVSCIEYALLNKPRPEYRIATISDKIDKLNITPAKGQDREHLLTLLSRGDFALAQVNKQITPVDHFKRYLVILHQDALTLSAAAEGSRQTNILAGFKNYASAHKFFAEHIPEISLPPTDTTQKLFLAVQYDNVLLDLGPDGRPVAHTGAVLKTAQKEGEFVGVVSDTDPFVSQTVPQVVIVKYDGLQGSVQFYDEKLKLLPVLPVLKSVDGRFFDHAPINIQQPRALKQKVIKSPKGERRRGPGKH